MPSPQKAPLLPPSEQTRTQNPHNNDVLCGRGGTINSHPGNEQYRTFVERKKRVYLTARFKREKRLIAQSIVDEVRKLNPPGRFLMKESNGEYWYDVGDEKARDKTSQALRENSISVRRQMEEEFNETRRQQAIAAGRDPNQSTEEISSKAHAEPPISGGLQPPQSGGGLQPRLTGLQPPGPGFLGRSSYGPLYDAQQPNQPSQTNEMHPHQYDYSRSAHPPYEQTSHSAPHNPYPPSFYGQQQDPFRPNPYSYGYALPPQAYDPNMISSNSQYAHHMINVPSMMMDLHQQPGPATRAANIHPEYHYQAPQHHNVDPARNAPIGHPEYRHQAPQQDGGPTQNAQKVPSEYHHQAPQQNDGPTSALRNRHSEEQLERHVQFESYHTQMLQSQDNYAQGGPPGAPQFPPLAMGESDIPLVIGAKKRSPNRHPQPRTQPFHSNNQMAPESPPHPNVYGTTPDLSPSIGHQHQLSPSTAQHQHRDDSLNVASPKVMQSSGLSYADMSQSTPLTFMSNPLSLKTEDSLTRYLRGMEDEIAGDVGQEVELVAHAPMLNAQDRAKDQETIVPRHHRPHYHGSISGRSTVDSASSGIRGTPPRHHKHDRRRKKHKNRGHIPSNSGKVQFDLSAAAFEGSNGDTTSPPAVREQGPCGQVAVSCGGMLPVPSPIVGRRQQQETSPMVPLSPNSLDIDKMSLCGTDNISHGGSILGGASLMNVFEEHDSIVGANALMDMSVSLGSVPSRGASSGSSPQPKTAMGLQPCHGTRDQYGDHESMMGASALMDLSVGGSAASARSSMSGNGSKTHSSSGSSSSKNKKNRSLSPASIDKREGKEVHSGNGGVALEDEANGWMWDGKSNQ